ncbi:glyoxalase/bleomycin resistance protein/dioxygenase [Nitzschia inconspicua]|uniref:Glyoxalase/bleomycin resistance protein/dioxygenase n=1 Tax=Nitzschia inconspicua TaxID=303405 RepID=A0A9K3KXH3_9STRA|nr:glyoxalase/bleomycin resistance protein/dioxygenase [Nitzschia inconspicua]
MKLGGTYLTFNGNCRQAMTFYSKVFGTKIDVAMTWADPHAFGGCSLPKELEDKKNAATEEDKNRMIHMSFMLDNGTYMMGCDVHPKMHKNPFTPGNNYQVVLEPDSKEEAHRLYDALQEGGSDCMPLQDMWWGSYHGSCTDKFGIRWMFDMSTFSSDEAKMKSNLMGAVGVLRASAKIADSTAAKLEALLDDTPAGESKMETEAA